ncbi:MAG: DUF1538 domain-containing protein [Clostridiaceae bacterium]
MNLFVSKLKEVLYSVLPITIVVMILNFTLTPMDTPIIAKFLIGSLLMIISLPIFLLGIDISITPIGEQISEVLVKSNKLWLILLGGGFFGLVVTIAEPDLHILSNQLKTITSGQFDSNLMVIMVAAGVGALVSMGMFRILKNIRLNRFMTVVYLIILILGLFTQPDFLGIAFDASGNTTGSISVPFILALAMGISRMTRSNETEENDGFGMLGIASSGAIIAVMLQGIFSKTEPIRGSLPIPEVTMDNVLLDFIHHIPQYMQETLIVILPILFLYLVIELIWIKMPFYKLRRIFVGSFYTYVGLVLFLTGVNVGFLDASRQVGYQIASYNSPWLLVLTGMIFGIITIPAEPSVHVLTRQIEDNTAGSIKALTVMITLCIGVAVAVGLSMLRILIPALQLWHILLPGMVIGIVLSYAVPDIFVGIAYDSGGVAAGTMTSVFILPFAQGAAEIIPSASIMLDSFGIIALIAMTPLIAVQILGLIYKLKTRPLLSESELDEDLEED